MSEEWNPYLRNIVVQWFKKSRDFAQVLKVIFQIRNNLFHGHKSPDDEDDRRLVGLACSILSPLLSPFVDQLSAQGAASVPRLSV